MPFQSKRATLELDAARRETLETISRSRSESLQRVERATMMLRYADGATISVIGQTLHTNRPKVERCVDKAWQLGSLAALADRPRKGRPAKIDDDACVWVVSLV